MGFIFQLFKLRFLTPRTILFLIRAKRIHGNNLCFLLKLAADRFANNIAITDGFYRLNYKELYEEVLNLSFTTQNRINFEENSVAIFACKNTVNHIILLYSFQNLGIRIILVNHRAHQNDIKKILNNQSQQCHFFTSEPSHLLLDGAINIDELITETKKGKKGQLISKKHAAVVFPTSGTTGNAKLIQKKNGAFYWLRSFSDLVFKTGIYKKKSIYISIPVSYGFGYTALLFTLVLGKKAFVTELKDQQLIAGLLIQEQIELLSGVPTSIFQVSEGLKGINHNISLIISGGAPLNEAILQSITSNLSKNIFSMYGSTEASTSFIADYKLLMKNVCALGKPLIGIKYRLEQLPSGGKELLIQSHLSNVSSDLWFHTGDLAEEDINGNLTWCGRKDNMILKGGFNIYPTEIENGMYQIPSIEDVFVKGQKDSVKGELIIAYVKMKPAYIFDEHQIKESLKHFLPGIKIPDKIFQTDNFEYTNTGKKINPK